MAAPPSNYDSNFCRVLEEFKATLSQDDLHDFKLSTLDDLKLSVLVIQEKQASERKMKNLARLKSFLEAMEQYDEVVKVFLNTSDILAFVWVRRGPVKFLLQVASTYTEALDALLEAYQDIGENIPLLKQYERMFKDNRYMHNVLELIYTDILEFHRKAIHYFKQRMWKQLFRATWKTFRTKFSGILTNLRRHKLLVESQANIIQFEEIQRARTAAEAHVRALQEAELKNMQVVLRSWLSAASSDVDQENAAKVRENYPNTGRWLLTKDLVRSWCEPNSSSIPLLWLNGKPGAGKSILASLLIEECRKLPNVHVAFFYCKDGDSQRNTFLAVARSILLQLSRQKNALLSYLFEEACTSGESLLESSKLAKEMLEVALKTFDKIYLIIDGLDECKKDEKLVISTWFQSTINNESVDDPARLRCLFISQDDNDTCKLFKNVPTFQMTSADNREDIAHFCMAWARKIQEKFELSTGDTDSLMKTVSSGADGMFLFARLVMRNLLAQTTKAGYRKEIAPEQFPRGLDEAYARIVHRVFTEAELAEREDAGKLLGWLVCAKRPLKWHEIQGAWSFNTDTQTFDYEERRLRTDSKELCGSLVEIHHGGVIDFVHLTAKQYLLQQNLVEKAPEEFKLACLCLSYLNLECFDDGVPEAHVRNSVREGCFAFMDYAVVYWSEHLRRCLHGVEPDNQAFGTLVGIVRGFLTKHHVRTKGQLFKSKKLSETFQNFREEDFFERLIEAVSASENQMKTQGKEGCKESPLNLLGQATRIREIMEEMSVRSDPQQKQKLQTLYGSTLFKCARPSCKSFYEGFLGSQERDRHFGKHERAFGCVYPGCHIALLGFKSEKDLTKHEMEYHGTPVDDSIFPWHQAPESIVIDQQIHLGNLPAVETWMQQFEKEIPHQFLVTGKNPKGALEAAVMCKNNEILKMLLSRVPADLFLKSKDGGYRLKTLLSVALESQNEDAVRMLLDVPEAVGDHDMSLMVSKALNRGLDDLAIVLLKSPHSGLFAFKERATWRAESYLTRAIRHGCIAVVRFLITQVGVVSDNNDSVSRTVLFASAEFGQEEITKFLLGTGKYNIRATSKSGETAALIAARQGHEAIIRLLFPQDPLPSDVKSLLESARLRNAAQAGDAEQVRILLEQKNIMPDLADRSGYTPLLLAAEKGHDSVVKELLRRGDVQLNRKTKLSGTSVKYGRTALHLSVYNGHVATVRQLLSRKGVDITSRTIFPGIDLNNALEIATRRGNEALITLLKESSSSRDPPPKPPVYQAPTPTQQPDPAQVSAFPDMGMGADQNFNLDFSTLDTGDVLENFDFDSFINTDDQPGFSFDPTLSYPTDGRDLS